jgi:hypothetical protein
MGFFRKTPPPAPAIRPAQVARLRAAMAAEDDAGMFGTMPDAPEGLQREWRKARAVLDAVERSSTQAEMRAADER